MENYKPPAFKKALYFFSIFVTVIFLAGCGNQSKQVSEPTTEMVTQINDDEVTQELISPTKEENIPEPKTVETQDQPKKLLSPEETWDLFQEGYREENLDKVLSACSPEGSKQERCQRQFLGVKEAGGLQRVANALGDIKLTSDLGELRFYRYPVLDTEKNEATSVSFRFIENVGWKIEEF